MKGNHYCFNLMKGKLRNFLSFGTKLISEPSSLCNGCYVGPSGFDPRSWKLLCASNSLTKEQYPLHAYLLLVSGNYLGSMILLFFPYIMLL